MSGPLDCLFILPFFFFLSFSLMTTVACSNKKHRERACERQAKGNADDRQ